MKTFLVVALAASVLAVAACGGNTATPAPSSATPDRASSAVPATPAPATTTPTTTTPTSEAASPATGDGLVGIAMPSRSSDRWIAEGDNLVRSLTALGYTTDLQYAEDDTTTQVSQVESMIGKGAKVLVIAAVDGTTFTDVLQKAADAGIKVLAYDRLIRNSPNVDYYTTFDSSKVGVLQAGSIVDALDLNNGAGPFNIELFGGSPEDTNAGLAFDGAIAALQPFISSGKLVVQSNETTFPEQVGTLGSDAAAARARMDTILATYYADRRVDAVLSPDDGISRGIIASLKQAGYYAVDKPGPAVSGQGAELPSVKSILAGEQTSTVFKDTRVLVAHAATMVDEMLKGATVDVNDTRTFDNGARVVPSFVVDVASVTKDNARKLLVDSGYYNPSDLQ
jgi:putative multiple sugar transport system substrate-binding protein